MVATRRSARRGRNGQLPADAAVSEPGPDASALSSVPCSRSRDDSPPGRPGRTREKGSSVIHNGYTLKQHVEAEKQYRQEKETLVVEELDEMHEDSRSLEEPPGWLPDGWIMEVCRNDGGSIYRYYTSPVSGYTFRSKMETLDYLFSGMEEHMLESQESAEDNELRGSHTWLPGGWLIEVRAGGKKMDKMYKNEAL